jgi:hypothetical protein
MGLFDNPVGWSKSVAGTKTRIVFMVLLQAIVCSLMIFYANKGSINIAGTYFIGVIFPSLYLIAIYKLLKLIGPK